MQKNDLQCLAGIRVGSFRYRNSFTVREITIPLWAPSQTSRESLSECGEFSFRGNLVKDWECSISIGTVKGFGRRAKSCPGILSIENSQASAEIALESPFLKMPNAKLKSQHDSWQLEYPKTLMTDGLRDENKFVSAESTNRLRVKMNIFPSEIYLHEAGRNVLSAAVKPVFELSELEGDFETFFFLLLSGMLGYAYFA